MIWSTKCLGIWLRVGVLVIFCGSRREGQNFWYFVYVRGFGSGCEGVLRLVFCSRRFFNELFINFTQNQDHPTSISDTILRFAWQLFIKNHDQEKIKTPFCQDLFYSFANPSPKINPWPKIKKKPQPQKDKPHSSSIIISKRLDTIPNSHSLSTLTL